MIQLHPGQLFTYREWSRWLAFRQSGVGQVLCIEEGADIVHVSLLFEHEDNWAPYVMHLPISVSALEESHVEVIKRVTPFEKAKSYVSAWRALFDRSQAGAFSVSLRRARKLIERTIADATPPNGRPFRIIETAYPVAGDAGRFSKVHVGLVWRVQMPNSGLLIGDKSDTSDTS